MTVEQKAEEYFQEQAKLHEEKGVIKHMKDVWLDGYRECQKEHEWHDLQKDPTDLPKENSRYLCLIETSVGGASVYECSDYDTEYNSWKDSYGDVIKWKEIK